VAVANAKYVHRRAVSLHAQGTLLSNCFTIDFDVAATAQDLSSALQHCQYVHLRGGVAQQLRC
jgi:hypothetical protein